MEFEGDYELPYKKSRSFLNLSYATHSLMLADEMLPALLQ